MYNLEPSRSEIKMEKEKKEVRIPTLGEKIKKGISDQDWIMMCYRKYKDGKCFRELNGHSLCDLCPKKSGKIVESAEKPREKGWLTEKEFREWLVSSKKFQRR